MLVGCSRDTLPESPNRAAKTAPAPEAARPRMPAAPAPEGPPWRWRTSKSDPEFMVTPPLVRSATESYRFVADNDRHKDPPRVERVDGDGKVVWSTQLESQFVDAAAMAYGGDHVIVAHHSHIASGCRLLALDPATGALVWKSDLIALGPVSHSKYRNRVQLGIEGDRAIVYGWESQGRYIETVDLDTGKSVGNARPTEQVAAIAWRWDSPDRTQFLAHRDPLAADGGGEYVYEGADPPAEAAIVRRGADGAAKWTAALPGEGDCGSVAMVERADRLFVVHYCSISSGAHLYAFDARAGKLRGETSLEGLGPVAHSEYYNDVEMRIDGGMLVVFGKEAMGRYIEARDPASLVLASSQVFSDW